MLDAAEQAVTAASRAPGREEEVRERRGRGRRKVDEGEGRLECRGSHLHRTPPPQGVAARPASFSPAASSRGSREEEGRGSPSRKQHQRRPPLASPSSAPHSLFLSRRVAASPRPRASRCGPLRSVRPPALPGSAPAPPPRPSGDP